METDYHKLIICTFDVKLIQSANYKKKIDELINFICASNNDVICLQGINDVKLLKNIINRVNGLNNDTNIDAKFYVFPNIDKPSDKTLNNYADIFKITWTKSTEQDLSNVDCLIISKYPIISTSKIEMKWDNILEFKYVYIANIDFNGVLISIYNAAFMNDFIGISNVQIRKSQIKLLKDIIETNIEHLTESAKTKYKSYCFRHIHIIACLSNITELLNDDINNEYLYFLRMVKCIDAYRYIRSIKCIDANNKKDATTSCGLRTNYILVYCDKKISNDMTENIIHTIGNALFKNNKLIIVNSIINKSLLYYDDFPIITTFLLEKSDSILNDTVDDSDVAISID